MRMGMRHTGCRRYESLFWNINIEIYLKIRVKRKLKTATKRVHTQHTIIKKTKTKRIQIVIH